MGSGLARHNSAMVDLAVIGAGAAGTFVANEMLRRRPSWSVELFERTDRIGGRLHSVAVPGSKHPIELGGMRYLRGHRHVDGVVAEHGLRTHPFDIGRGPDRSILRGVTSEGASDPRGGAGYADGRAVERWTSLADGGAPGAGAPSPILEAAASELQAVFPSVASIPAPLGSAFKHWGADPLECGWHYWRAGADSVRVIADIAQPSPGHELYVCGEAYSHWQAWVEGALETAATVVERMTASSRGRVGRDISH